MITDLRDASSPNAAPYIAHLAHSHPVPAAALLEPLSRVLGVRLIPFTQWVDLLEQSVAGGDAEKNPGLKMVDFFKESASDAGSQNAEAFGVVRMDITNALNGSQVLREDVKELSVEDVTSWVSYWRKSGNL